MWIVDPKAIHHILQVSPHLYEKTLFAKELSEALMDRGLPAVDGAFPLLTHAILPSNRKPGDEHKRHRRAMAPAFGLIESKALYPYFACCSNTVGHCSIHARLLISGLNANASTAGSSPINGMDSSSTKNLDKPRSLMYILG